MKNHSDTNFAEIPSAIIVILSFLCFVLFLASWNAKLPKKIETRVILTQSWPNSIHRSRYLYLKYRYILLKLQISIFYILSENRDICISVTDIYISIIDICISNKDICISQVTDMSYYIKYRHLYILLEISVFEMHISALNRLKPKWDAIKVHTVNKKLVGSTPVVMTFAVQSISNCDIRNGIMYPNKFFYHLMLD